MVQTPAHGRESCCAACAEERHSILGSTMSIPYPPHTPAGAPTCYRHPDRQTYISCNRCGRPMCPECMRNASVGHQCVDCVQAATQVVLRPNTAVAGARRGPTPALTYILIAVNVVVFGLQAVSPGLQSELALWPPAVAGGDTYRLVSSAFIHYGIVHLLFNMWALYVLGPPLEEWLGRWRFGALYALSALGGSVLVYLFSPLTSATGGASGAVFGLFGATFVMAKRLNLDVRMIVVLIVVNLLNSRGPSVPVEGLPGPPDYVDVNGDNVVNPLDALEVINYINSQSGGSSGGEGEGFSSVQQVVAPWSQGWNVDIGRGVENTTVAMSAAQPLTPMVTRSSGSRSWESRSSSNSSSSMVPSPVAGWNLTSLNIEEDELDTLADDLSRYGARDNDSLVDQALSDLFGE